MKTFRFLLLPFSLFGAWLIAGCQLPTPAKQHSHNDGDGHSHSHANPASSGATQTKSATTKLAFSSEPAAIAVGKPATWTLHITDAKSGDAVNNFEIEMTKKMHLIVVKNDLSWFNHLHPQFRGDGKFQITTQIPSAGTYKIYADYTLPKVGQEVPQGEFATAGQAVQPAQVSLVPDQPRGAWLVKRCNAHPESEPDAQGGKNYEVALMPMPSPIVAGRDTMLHFQIRDAQGVPVKNLQPYLGAMGHCVILSSDTKAYLHSHPMGSEMKAMKGMDHSMSAMKIDETPAKPGDPNVMFHTSFPKPGLYKVWGQFQHEGKIITAAFVVRAAAEKAEGTTQQ